MKRRSDPGVGLRPGDEHYRAYVGPPEDYDVIGGLQFALLFAAGMRDTHRVLDVGCGSLRAGRLLIPYLQAGKYVGLEPNKWLVRQGIRAELGRSILRTKRPTFVYRSDFPADQLGARFDFVLAQSIFSHTHDDLTVSALDKIRRGLADDGLLVATFLDGPSTPGTGWVYPQSLTRPWTEMTSMLSQAGLVGRRLKWPHPRQIWFAAAPPAREARLDDLAQAVSMETAHG